MRSLSKILSLAVVCATTMAGCSDMGAPVNLRARSELSALSLDFGTVAVSGFATRNVTVINSGSANLVGSAALLACPDYQLDAGGGPFSIAPGQRLIIVVRFVPSGIGSFPCTLDLGPNCSQVVLAGAGALQPSGAQWAVSTGALDFGFAAVGQSNLRFFTITSAGTAPLLVNVVSSCPEFQVITGGGSAELAPGASIAVTIGFSPLTGGAFSCVVATGPGGPDVRITGGGTTVSYSGDLQPIFIARGCMNCHGCPPGFGCQPFEEILFRSANLVNVVSSRYAPALLVKPYDPANSVLHGKVENTGQFGSVMPPGGIMSQAERDKIRTWILEGAHHN